VIIPYLTTGIKASKHPEYQLGTYMIISQIVSKLALSFDLTDLLLKEILQNAVLHKEALMCVLCIFQSQSLKELSSTILEKLFKIK
jgi:hypothetical protein